MADFFLNGPGLTLLALFFGFYWAPFAIGAYLLEIWLPAHQAHSHRPVVQERPA